MIIFLRINALEWRNSMSYCVECGVKLAEYEKECPLCTTPVYNPNEIKKIINKKHENQINKSDNKNIKDAEIEEVDYMCRDWVDDLVTKSINGPFLASIILLSCILAMLITSAITYVFTKHLGWAIYVFGALICIWSYAIFPLLYPNIKPYIYASIDIVVSAIYLLLVNYFTGFYPWYLPLGLPLILIIGAVSVLTMYIIRRKDRRRIEKVAWIVLIGAFLTCAIDMTVTHFRTESFSLSWAWYVSIPLIAFGIVLLIIAKNVNLSEWLRRNLFV